METSDWEDSPADPAAELTAEVPSVVAVVVTTDPDERFDAVLASLAVQDYPALTVLVVDAGSRDDLGPRVAARLPDAFLRRLTERESFAVAAAEALAAVEGANYLLFCEDDVVLADDAISLMVEEAYRSNAGVVGPKFVDAERPEVLLEIGLSADKLGVSAPMVEAGEIDHEQHDAVRDVFAVPKTTMLVRADLCAEMGGFDPAFVAGMEEIDLCWRARLAGARVIVAPDAVVRRPWAAHQARFGSDPDAVRAREPTQRLRMLLRSYSAMSLLRVLPQAAAVTFLQAVGLVLMGRGRRAWGVVRAWFHNARDLRSTMRERRRIQGSRVLPDRDVRSFQMHGFAYIRAFLAGQLDLGGRVDALGGTGRALTESVAVGLRRPGVLSGAALVVLVMLGSRDLLAGSVPAVGSMLPWPEPTDAFREFTSSWRFAAIGSAAPAPPAFALIGALGTLLGGSGALARTLVVVGAIPLGAYGAHRLLRPLATTAWPPLAAAAAYAVVPLPRNAIADGRLGPLVFYALAPFLLVRVLRVSGLEPFGTPGPGGPAADRRRALLALGVLTAVSTALFPPSLVLVAAMAVALLAASPVAGDRLAAGRGLVAVLVSSGIALALLFPWSLGMLLPVPDAAALGFAYRERPDLVQALLFDTGPARVGIAGLLLVVGAQPLVIGSGTRLRWGFRAWILALVGWTAAWLPGRVGLDGGFPPAEAPLVLAALGLAMAAGLGSGVLREELQRTGLSWRQGVAVAALGALGLATFPFLVDTFDGRWRLPERDWHRTLAWMSSETPKGGFRVLWVGDPSTLPAHPFRLDDGTGFAVTRDGPGDATALWPPPGEGATAAVSGALESVLAGRTDRLGHLLGPLAVRYVAYPRAAEPGPIEDADEDADEGADGSAEGRASSDLERTLARQVDLAELRVDPGIRLFENQAWMPAAALVDGEAAEAVVSTAARDAVRFDLSGARPVGGTPRAPEVEVSDADRDRVGGVLLLAESFDDGWETTAGGALRPHFRAFGLVNGFVVEDVDRIEVSHPSQLLRYGALAVEAVVLVLVLGAWNRRRAAERAERRRWRASSRDVRPGPEASVESAPAGLVGSADHA